MVIEKNRPLIDPSIKIYSEKTDELPNISFGACFKFSALEIPTRRQLLQII